MACVPTAKKFSAFCLALVGWSQSDNTIWHHLRL